MNEKEKFDAARAATRVSLNADRISADAVVAYDAALEADIGVQAALDAVRNATIAALNAARTATKAVRVYCDAVDTYGADERED